MLESKGFPADVVKVIDHFRIVINRGSIHGVKLDQRFLLYTVTPETIWDSNGEPLGNLEIPKGTGRVVHAQEKMSIVQSDRTKVVKKPITLQPFLAPGFEEQEVLIPFDDPELRDRVKPI